MPLRRKTAVIGTAIKVPVSGDRQSHEELLYDITQEVLRDAGLSIEDIDGIVVGSNDQFDGRAISVMAASGSVGGVDRDILSTPSAGEHAVIMGALRIASGQFETHLVLAWSPNEASSLSEAQRLGNDPYFHRILPLDEIGAAALQANVLRGKDAGYTARAEARSAQNLAAGRVSQKPSEGGEAQITPPWPLSADMAPPAITGLVAMVLASEDYVAAKGLTNVAWLRGMGWATEAAFLGDRDLATAPALEEAADRAYAEAGITTPASAFDVIELTGATPYQELLAQSVLKLEEPGRAAVNPSGGVSTLNPVFCTGTIRIAEAARQVMGRAGTHQIAGARRALAHASSGFAMMYQAVLVLDADRQGTQA